MCEVQIRNPQLQARGTQEVLPGSGLIDIIRSCACMVWIYAFTARRAYKANSAYLTQYDLRDELYLYDELCLLDESVYSNQR